MNDATDRYAVYVRPNWRLYATLESLEAARAYLVRYAAMQYGATGSGGGIFDRVTRTWI